jgi:hypothetical protein
LDPSDRKELQGRLAPFPPREPAGPFFVDQEKEDVSMRRRSGFLSQAWRFLVFIVTIRAVAGRCRSPRLYAAER